jgi:hypothetical protein
MFAKFARNFKGKKKHSNERSTMVVWMANLRFLSTVLDNQNCTQTSSEGQRKSMWGDFFDHPVLFRKMIYDIKKKFGFGRKFPNRAFSLCPHNKLCIIVLENFNWFFIIYRRTWKINFSLLSFRKKCIHNSTYTLGVFSCYAKWINSLSANF